MTYPNIQKDVQVILDHIKSVSFVKGYKATNEEAMGLLLSKYFEWDGVKIMKASAEGLTDANFHIEARQVEEMIAKTK